MHIRDASCEIVLSVRLGDVNNGAKRPESREKHCILSALQLVLVSFSSILGCIVPHYLPLKNQEDERMKERGTNARQHVDHTRTKKKRQTICRERGLCSTRNT